MPDTRTRGAARISPTLDWTTRLPTCRHITSSLQVMPRRPTRSFGKSGRADCASSSGTWPLSRMCALRRMRSTMQTSRASIPVGDRTAGSRWACWWLTNQRSIKFTRPSLRGCRRARSTSDLACSRPPQKRPDSRSVICPSPLSRQLRKNLQGGPGVVWGMAKESENTIAAPSTTPFVAPAAGWRAAARGGDAWRDFRAGPGRQVELSRSSQHPY